MARPAKQQQVNNNSNIKSTNKATNINTKEMDEFCSDLVNSINKQMGEVGLYSISSDDSILQIKRFISTGSKQLDYIIANKPNGGLPEGRIVEIQGPPSIGKTHIAYEAIKRCQAQGGIGVFIDAENATSLDTLIGLGMKKTGLIYSDENIIEKIFSLIEGVVAKARMIKKDVPILIVWDSVAASSPKDESEADYEKNTIGLAARVFSKGFRKLTPVLKENNVTLLLLNQQRMKIGVLYGDATTTPGGNAIPFHSSVRLRLTGGQQIKDKDDEVIGINVTAKTIKNKVARPARDVAFQIMFGVGITEDEQTFDVMRAWCDEHKEEGYCLTDNNKRVSVEGAGAWKTFVVTDMNTGEEERNIKFYKADFGDKILRNAELQDYVSALYDAVYIKTGKDHREAVIEEDENGTVVEEQTTTNDE